MAERLLGEDVPQRHADRMTNIATQIILAVDGSTGQHR
jgi:hypothetical protein